MSFLFIQLSLTILVETSPMLNITKNMSKVPVIKNENDLKASFNYINKNNSSEKVITEKKNAFQFSDGVYSDTVSFGIRSFTVEISSKNDKKLVTTASSLLIKQETSTNFKAKPFLQIKNMSMKSLEVLKISKNKINNILIKNKSHCFEMNESATLKNITNEGNSEDSNHYIHTANKVNIYDFFPSKLEDFQTKNDKAIKKSNKKNEKNIQSTNNQSKNKKLNSSTDVNANRPEFSESDSENGNIRHKTSQNVQTPERLKKNDQMIRTVSEYIDSNKNKHESKFKRLELSTFFKKQFDNELSLEISKQTVNTTRKISESPKFTLNTLYQHLSPNSVLFPSKFEEKISSLDCSIRNFSIDSTVWQGNKTHELSLPILVSGLY